MSSLPTYKLNDVTVIILRSTAQGYLMDLLNKHADPVPTKIKTGAELEAHQRQGRARELLARQAMASWPLHNVDRDFCNAEDYLSKGEMTFIESTEANGEGVFWTLEWRFNRFSNAEGQNITYKRLLHLGLG